MSLIQIDWENYTFRCHELGYIMSDPKGDSPKVKYEKAKASYDKYSDDYLGIQNKMSVAADRKLIQLDKAEARMKKYERLKDVPHLSRTCMSHLADIHTSLTKGLTKDIRSKYIEKGLMVEEDSITQYCKLVQRFLKKNAERKFNEYINGECDIDDSEFDMIVDAKSSWDAFTFGRVSASPINPVYEWQLRGYTWLWERRIGRLAYNLINTPEHLIALECKKLMYELPSEEFYKEACDEIRKNHTYDHIPLEKKVKIFDIKRDEEKEEKIKARVIECRKFLIKLDNANYISDELTDDERDEEVDS
jgi:hypothetical protein